ncbi:hypothetical protein DESC_710101 [Desulfosarcina cetonica]|nr:hypothetical protein DESC_710101 [Desulfosarcina cetonica]
MEYVCMQGSSLGKNGSQHDARPRGQIEGEAGPPGIVGILQGMVNLIRQKAPVTAEAVVVGIQRQAERAGRRRNRVIGKGALGVKIEGEDISAAHEGQHLVAIMLPQRHQVAGRKQVGRLDQPEHGPIETGQQLVLESGIVHQRPLPAGVAIAPAIAFPGEVDPLGMTELVAHEVEITAARRGQGGQADHLVQGHGPGHADVRVIEGHVLVHGTTGHAEHKGLIAHQGLVVGFGIADGLLLMTPVGELMPQVAHGPLFVGRVLGEPDPVVGHPHGKAIVKAHPARIHGQRQSRHAADVLGDGDGVGPQAMDQFVGQGQVGQGILVHAGVEIVVVPRKGPFQAVVGVKHAGDAVEAKAVHPEGIQPVAAVGQQEMNHGRLGVIETAAVPGVVVAARTGVKVLVLRAVELAQALDRVGDRMGVHQVHDHGQPVSVGRVDQGHEIFRWPETRRRGEKAGHMVAERAVVRVLLNGHELDGVVPGLDDAWQDGIAELAPGADAFGLLGHAHMNLVDQRGAIWPHERRRPPAVGRGRGPYLGIEDQRLRVLHHPAGIGRNTVAGASRPVNPQAEKIAVGQGPGRQMKRPLPLVADTRQGVGRILAPAAEIPHQVDRRRVGRPFPKGPPAGGAVQAEIFVARGQVQKIHAPFGDARAHGLNMVDAPHQGVTVRFEKRIGPDQPIHAWPAIVDCVHDPTTG